jgi:hypothetical protein
MTIERLAQHELNMQTMTPEILALAGLLHRAAFVRGDDGERSNPTIPAPLYIEQAHAIRSSRLLREQILSAVAAV